MSVIAEPNNSFREYAPLPQKSIIDNLPPETNPPYHTSLFEHSKAQRNFMTPFIKAYLAERIRNRNLSLDESDLSIQAKKMEGLCNSLSDQELSDFLKNPYVSENLEYFLDLDPAKINLALQVNRYVSYLAQNNNYEAQFVPVLNLAGFTILEKLREDDFSGLNAKSILEKLENQQGHDGLSRGKTILIDNIHRYLSKINPDLKDAALEEALVSEACQEIYNRLIRHTKEMADFGQSQGVEIEVLKYLTKSSNAVKRGVDTVKWLPRGIPLSEHSRKDWRLLPLLGIDEDIGERKFQVYEMSTLPSETAASQTTLIFELILGGFISEEKLSEKREGYSLHVSTVFPKTIINERSLGEYRAMARALAGAFSSDQRIAFGGFMSGGAEITDKSSAGRLKEIAKRETNKKQNNIGSNMALVEVRNLDITPRGQYSAILHKEVLDYAFRCSWQKKVDFDHKFSSLELFAGEQWNKFISESNNIFARYGLSQEQLRQKYSKDWEQHAWQEMASARENNPQLKVELANLIRQIVSEIKKYKKENETVSVGKPVKYLTYEPLSTSNNYIFISKSQREALGLSLEDKITLICDGKRTMVKVGMAHIRADKKIEGMGSPFIRVSEDVLKTLDLPRGYACHSIYNRTNGELHLDAVQGVENGMIKINKPRTLLIEPQGLAHDRFYMTYADRRRFGLKNGDEITICFGKMQKKIKIAESKIRPDGSYETPMSGNWRLSENLVTEFGIPEGFRLRAKYDVESKTFSFGPTLAYLKTVEDGDANQIRIKGGNTFFQEIFNQGQKYGVCICLIDPNKQNPFVLKTGRVDAFIFDKKGRLQSIRIPIPDVSFDKEIDPRDVLGQEVFQMFDHHIVPKELMKHTVDKLDFATLLQKQGLGMYHPDTISLDSVDGLTKFFETRNQLIIKPRYGQKSAGIISVERTVDGYHVVTVGKNSEGISTKIDVIVSSIQDVLDVTKGVRENRKYIVQEKIPLARYTFDYDGNTYTRVLEIRTTFNRGIDGLKSITGMKARAHDPELMGEEYLFSVEEVLDNIFPGRKKELLDVLQKLSSAVMSALESVILKPIGEVTVDIGIREDGQPVIIEANSKGQTRSMFTRDQDAIYNSTAKSIEYALHLTNLD